LSGRTGQHEGAHDLDGGDPAWRQIADQVRAPTSSKSGSRRARASRPSASLTQAAGVLIAAVSSATLAAMTSNGRLFAPTLAFVAAAVLASSRPSACADQRRGPR